MDRYTVLVMPRASKELSRILSFISVRSPQNARGMLQTLFDAIDSLDRLPDRYEVHHSARRAARVVRSMAVPPYIVYYRIRESERRVEVVAVIHGARQQPQRFK